MPNAIKIAIAEDKAPLREAIQQSLGFFKEVEVQFTARNGEDMLAKCEALLPDLVLLDIEMPVLDGIETAAKLRERYPALKILMLTVFDQEDRIMEAIVAGANGYLLKEEHPGRIVEAIEDVMDGGAPMSTSIATKALALIRKSGGRASSDPKAAFGISEREMQILSRMSKGLNYQQVSEQLFISPKTVRNHIQHIYKKLQVNSKTEAINKARQEGWL